MVPVRCLLVAVRIYREGERPMGAACCCCRLEQEWVEIHGSSFAAVLAMLPGEEDNQGQIHLHVILTH